jgi:divalent metal cation (Fe/Co/Zn/Cd) transporter
MDDVLHDSLGSPYVKSDSRQATEDLLRFVIKVFLALALLGIVSAMMGRSFILLTDGLYSAGTAVYAVGLLLAYQESRRPSDDSYPYGYGNRVATLRLAALCVMAVMCMYILFRYISYKDDLLGNRGIAAIATSLVTVGISFAVYLKFVRTRREIDGPGLDDLELVLKGSVVVSAMSLLAALWGLWIGLRGELVLGMLSVVVSLCMFVKAFHETFRVLTDKNIASRSTRSVSLFAQRVAGNSQITGVKSRAIGVLTHIEMQAAFPMAYTVAEANKIERDIESVLRRKLPRIGEVVVYWQT